MPSFYFRNATLFVLPVLSVYFLWKRRSNVWTGLSLALVFAFGALFANVFPFHSPEQVDNFPEGSDTQVLTALHLPIALWLMAVGVAYVGGRWFSSGRRMDFVRFSGELAIYYVLIALGGGVLIGFTVDDVLGHRDECRVVDRRLAGPVRGGRSRHHRIMARGGEAECHREHGTGADQALHAALYVLLLAFLGTMAWTGNPINVEREVLIGFDLLLVLVVGLVLYAASARDPQAPPDFFDGLQLLLVVSALVVDGVALAAIAARISEFGFTPNRVAALGENLILLVNLAWTAWLYALPPPPGLVRRPGAMADRLSARLRCMGGIRGYRLPALVRLPLTPSIECTSGRCVKTPAVSA